MDLEQNYLRDNLIKLPVPEGSWEKTGTFVCASKNYHKKDVLLIFMTPNPYDNQESKVAYVQKALRYKYGVLLMNLSHNYLVKYEKLMPCSGSPEEHACYVWNQYIMRTKASDIFIIGYSYGGIDSTDALSRTSNIRGDFVKRVRAIAFFSCYDLKPTNHVRKVARNWCLMTGEPIGTLKKTRRDAITRCSAVPYDQLSTNMDAIFDFFKYRLTKYYERHPYTEYTKQADTEHRKQKRKCFTKRSNSLLYDEY